VAKLTLDNGNELYIKAVSASDCVGIIVANTKRGLKDKDGSYFYLASVWSDGVLETHPSLEGNINPGLQYDELGAIVVDK
jgi:hypothetical protein